MKFQIVKNVIDDCLGKEIGYIIDGDYISLMRLKGLLDRAIISKKQMGWYSEEHDKYPSMKVTPLDENGEYEGIKVEIAD